MFEIAIASFSCRWKALFKVEFLCCSLEVDANGTGLFCLRSRLSFRCFVQFRFFFFSFTLGLGFVLCICLASLPCFCSLTAKSLFFVTVNFFIYKQVIAISRKCFPVNSYKVIMHCFTRLWHEKKLQGAQIKVSQPWNSGKFWRGELKRLMHGVTYLSTTLQSTLQGPDYKSAFSSTNTRSETCPVVGLINCKCVIWFYVMKNENIETSQLFLWEVTFWRGGAYLILNISIHLFDLSSLKSDRNFNTRIVTYLETDSHNVQ